MMETKYYTKYKNTNIPLIDEIPTNWTLGRVKNILDYTHYYPIGDGDHGSIKPDMYLDKGVPYIRVQNLSWNFDINYENLVYISQKVNKENRKSILKPGDILIAKTGATVGKMAIIPPEITEANTTSSVGKITINKEKYDNKYFAYLFLSFVFRQQIIETAYQKSAQPGFNIDDLIEFKILIPPKYEQEQIAKYLDIKTTKIEQTITKNKKLIILLKEKRTSLINQTVTKGLNPYVPMKESGIEWIGKIPEKWNYRKINTLSNIKRGASPRPIDDQIYFDENGEYAWVRISNVTSSKKYLTKTEQRLSKLGKSLSAPLEPGSIFISIAATVGKPIITKIKCCVHDGFVYFDNLNVNEEYLYYIFESGEPYKGLGKLGTQLNLNREIIGQIRIPYPPISEQKQIVEYLDKKTQIIDKTIEKVEKNIELLEEYKESLIHHVVTGKIDVRGVEV